MNFCRHLPDPPLSAFIDWLWYYDDLFMDHDRENVLPDGTFELVTVSIIPDSSALPLKVKFFQDSTRNSCNRDAKRTN